MILIMGLPGAGKGTQGKIMADQHGMHLISMGEMVRLFITGERRARMLAGELLEDEEVIYILDRVLDSLPNKEQCVLDGFPRTIAQAEWLVEKAKKSNFSIRCVINLDASRSTVKKRLQARGRIDDRDEVIEERFKEYGQLTSPLINWFKDHKIKVITINAEQTVDQVNTDVSQALNL